MHAIHITPVLLGHIAVVLTHNVLLTAASHSTVAAGTDDSRTSQGTIHVSTAPDVLQDQAPNGVDAAGMGGLVAALQVGVPASTKLQGCVRRTIAL